MTPTPRGAALPMEVLAAIAAATAQLLKPAALYDVLREQVGRLVECDAFYLALWDTAAERMRFVAHTDRGTRLPPSESALGRGRRAGWCANDARWSFGRPPKGPGPGNRFGSAEPSHSAIHAPMLMGDRLIGVLSAQSYRAGAYDAEAVRGWRPWPRTPRSRSRLAHRGDQPGGGGRGPGDAGRLRGAAVARADLSGLGTLDAVVERGLQAAIAVAHAAGAMIAGRPGEQQPGLVVVGPRGERPGITGSETSWGSGTAGDGRAARGRAGRTGSGGGTGRRSRSPAAAPHRPGAMVPMRFGSVVTGVLTVSGAGAEWPVPGDDTLLLLQAVADQVAAAVSGLRLR